MTDYQILTILWNKNVRINYLRYSFLQVEIWDNDIDYGLETYNNEIATESDKLTKEEYTQIKEYIDKHKKNKEMK